jgi:hypothetical protein
LQRARAKIAWLGMTNAAGGPLTRWFGWREIVSEEDFERIFSAIEARIDAPIRTTIPMLYVEGVRCTAAEPRSP